MYVRKEKIVLKKQWKLSNGKMFPYFCDRFTSARIIDTSFLQLL
jgi:hypothetical protein